MSSRTDDLSLYPRRNLRVSVLLQPETTPTKDESASTAAASFLSFSSFIASPKLHTSALPLSSFASATAVASASASTSVAGFQPQRKNDDQAISQSQQQVKPQLVAIKSALKNKQFVDTSHSHSLSHSQSQSSFLSFSSSSAAAAAARQR